MVVGIFVCRLGGNRRFILPILNDALFAPSSPGSPPLPPQLATKIIVNRASSAFDLFIGKPHVNADVRFSDSDDITGLNSIQPPHEQITKVSGPVI